MDVQVPDAFRLGGNVEQAFEGAVGAMQQGLGDLDKTPTNPPPPFCCDSGHVSPSHRPSLGPNPIESTTFTAHLCEA